MTMGGPTYVFPDTNVFLHFTFFDQINWLDLAKADEVVIVVTVTTVVAELDKHKHEHRSDKKRELARRVLKKFETLDSDGGRVRDKVRFEFWPEHPPETPGLDPKHPDDRHVGAVAHFATKRGASNVMIATDDTGMNLKAKARGVAVVKMPETLRLPPEPNEHEAELKALRAERSRRPKLKLCFDGGENLLATQLRPKGVMSDEEIDQRVQLEMTVGVVGIAFGRGDYEQSLRRYYKSHREFEERKMYTVRASLVLVNDGEAPADDIDLTIEVPERISLTAEEDVEPEMPARPDPFTIAALRSPYDAISLASLRDTLADPDDWKVSDEVRASFWVRRLKQHTTHELPPVFLRVKDREHRQGFEIDALIRGGDPPLNESVKLHVALGRTR